MTESINNSINNNNHENDSMLNELFNMKNDEAEETLAKNFNDLKKADTERHGQLIEVQNADGEVVTVRELCPQIREKPILEINKRDMVVMKITTRGITLILRGESHGAYCWMKKRIIKSKDGYIFKQRMQYRDALWWMNKMGYKKEREDLSLSKSKKYTHYCVMEYWVSDEHESIVKGLNKLLNLE